jgi:hypothetical protein
LRIFKIWHVVQAGAADNSNLGNSLHIIFSRSSCF